MNGGKGQFSIIAALLVAAVLIATVVMTYSMIRTSPIQVQPQILSTIDETNLALKEILGFTIGYYGSVLKVTGNSTYAKELAINYTKSGLENMARMHPELGASFNLSSVDLSTYWYSNCSWSRGRLAVNYSLAGLGLYGMRYETSCELKVQVKELSSNQTRLLVTKDGGEPLLSLTKQNFKFYSYVYENSTWALISPSIEPTLDADGTYTINMSDPALANIDKYSYIVQVEDPRGLIAVVSSFSRYTLRLTWNSTMYPPTGAVNMTLIDHESFEGTWPPTGWTATGNWAKENDQHYNGAYSADFDGGDWWGRPSSGYLTAPSLNCYGAIAIYVDFWYMDEGCESGEFLLQYSNNGGNTWTNAFDLGATTSSQWLRYQQVITDSQYFTSNFRIRWATLNVESNKHAYVDYVTVTVTKQEPPMTIVVELLQNGTMRWLGQNLNLTTQAKPVPPIPVKAIRVNQTINGVNQEVPFQIEDWASDYKIPLGLTNNASIFGNRQMLVFLANPSVEKVIIWWNGSDTAVQTPYAYTNRYFTDDPDGGTLTNGLLTLDINNNPFTVTSKNVQGGLSVTASFMRVNGRDSMYGSGPAYAIFNGVIRDIVHAEAEWRDGVPNCYNFYSHIVITLPANATYYTYQLRLIFLNSTDKPRTITEIRPLRITASGTSTLTENGTSPNGYPNISTSTGLFYNMSGVWQHHWSQINSSLTKGFGIMFTDEANKMLYYFDKIAGANTGALSVSSSAIDLLPVSSRAQVNSFTDALDICWYGAVVTFDGTTPIYKSDGNGLWVLVEYPPTITITTEN
ncbi:MAG: hypothetical protein QW270_07325 [Candidatus Bathyarchaeia archaeon]